MKDIANELGISVATVSRALRDSSKISEETRKTVQDFAREHNFHANAIAENLRHSKVKPQKLIGVIVPEFLHYFFASVLSGIEEEAVKRGYRIMVAQSRESYETEVAICDSFYYNRVCGVIVSQAKETSRYDHFSHLQKNQVPLVFFDRICTKIDASRVVVDDYHGAYTAVSHLIETGCKRIAFCGAKTKMEIVKNRLNGYKDALLRHGFNIDEDLIFECDNRNAVEEIMPSLLDSPNRPDGFFTVNDDIAIGVVHVAKRKGLRVPEDISVCGFTNGNQAKSCDPMLTTVDQRGLDIGHEAADLLISQVEGELPINKSHKRIVRTKLVIRGTTRE